MLDSTIAVPKVSKWQRPVVWGFFVVLLLLGVWLVRDYGISADEDTSRQNGMISLKYVLQRFAPHILEKPAQASAFAPYKVPLAEYIDRDYGVLFELPVSVVERTLGLENPREIYWLRHLCTFLVSWSGVLAVYQLGRRRFADWRWGLFGAVLLVLSPRLFAESFYNDKDVVFMALCAIATNTAVRFIERPTWGRALTHALVCALAIDVRIMAVLWPLATLALLALRGWHGEYRRQLAGWLGLGYIVLTVSFVVGLWPYLWAAPLDNFALAFRNMMHFRWNNTMLFRGVFLDATNLPWTYAPVWIGITTPIVHLLLLLVGLGAVLRQLGHRRWRLYATEGEWQDLLFVGLGVLPLVAVIGLHSVLYDGWRQLYFVYPALVLLAVRGAALLAGWRPAVANRYRRWWSLLYASTLVISLATLAVRMVRMHPYQNIYFNVLAGKDIVHRYEMDYWGLGIREGLAWVAAHSDGETRVCIPNGMSWTGVCSLRMLPDFSQSRIKIVDKIEDADYLITTYRWHPEDQPYEEVFRLQPDELRILSVFQLH